MKKIKIIFFLYLYVLSGLVLAKSNIETKQYYTLDNMFFRNYIVFQPNKTAEQKADFQESQLFTFEDMGEALKDTKEDTIRFITIENNNIKDTTDYVLMSEKMLNNFNNIAVKIPQYIHNNSGEYLNNIKVEYYLTPNTNKKYGKTYKTKEVAIIISQDKDFIKCFFINEDNSFEDNCNVLIKQIHFKNGVFAIKE